MKLLVLTVVAEITTRLVEIARVNSDIVAKAVSGGLSKTLKIELLNLRRC
jgi:hypothetical protein